MKIATIVLNGLWTDLSYLAKIFGIEMMDTDEQVGKNLSNYYFNMNSIPISVSD